MVHRTTACHAQKAQVIPLSFYRHNDVLYLGKALLGKMLYTKIDGKLTGGIIIETESYEGVTDKACHAFGGRRTKRTEVMYKMGGITYVYLCYGMHCLLNIVTGPKNTPHAVLIRGLKPVCGIDIMIERRGRKENLTNGPGSLTKALGITMEHNEMKLDRNEIWLEEGVKVKKMTAGPRIGVDYAGKDALLPYRFVCELD